MMGNAMLLYAHLTDKELVDKVKKGNTECFEVLIRRHNQALYRVGRMFGIGHNNVEDLIQNTHHTSYDQLSKFDIKISYRTWVTRIMINKCLNKPGVLSRQYKNVNEEQWEPAGFGSPSANHYDTERMGLKKDLSDKLERCIEQLPISLRSVFVLHEMEGYPTKETSDLLSIPEDEVKLRAERAKNMMKRKLRNWYYNSDIYSFHHSSNDRLVLNVMSQLDKKNEYHFEQTLVPR
jgi:RNA polymerase sigma factor (sigma-70 family)